VSAARAARSRTRARRRCGGAPVVVLALVAVTAGCPRRVPPGGLPGEPELRVGLAVGRDSITLGGDAELLLTDEARGTPVGSIPAGRTWWAVRDAGGLRLTRPDGTGTPVLARVGVVSVSEGRFVMLNGRRYRGRVSLSRDAVGVTAVNAVPLESYVAAVAGHELGPRQPNEEEALLAQAIVSRTYALRNRGRWRTLGFDAHADVRDQVYFGVGAESPAAWAAVRRTAGRVVRYRGELIDAFFHSTCGYRTADPREAFLSAGDRPYLRPVSDRNGRGYYCERSPRFRWREEWDASTLRAILSRTLQTVTDLEAGGLPPIADVEVSRTGRSGRVAELRIVFPRGDARVPGPNVREVLRPAPDRALWSTAFQVHATRASGTVTRLVVTGAGSGHGVGMCQWGAIGRARAGQDHRRILETYFPGTTVDRIY
jgi:stage II sporulation protein D